MHNLTKIWRAIQNIISIRNFVLISVAALWMCSIFMKAIGLSLPAATLDIIEKIRNVEAIVIGSWLHRVLEFLVGILRKFGFYLNIEEHSRYAFNLMALKLIGDAQVDAPRYANSVNKYYGRETNLREKLTFARNSKLFYFIMFEFVFGTTIALISAIFVGQYPFGKNHIYFAIFVIGSVLTYEFIKLIGHICFDLYNKGWKSNLYRYFNQFVLFTFFSAAISFMIGFFTSNLSQEANDGLLIVFVFIILLSGQQFISALITKNNNKKNHNENTEYLKMGQTQIGLRIISLVMIIFGWMVILWVYGLLFD